jgi:hypothetical protein
MNVGVLEKPSALLLIGRDEKPQTLTPGQTGNGYELTVGVAHEQNGNVRTLRAAVANRTNAPVRLRSVTLGEMTLTLDGDAASWWLGTLAPTPCAGPLAPKQAPLAPAKRGVWQTFFSLPHHLPKAGPDEDIRSFRDWVTLYADFGARGCVLGAGGVEADVSFHCRVENGSVRVTVVSEMSDVVLAPGESRASEEVTLIVGPYEEALPALLGRLAANTGRRTHRKPPFGWCSWYDRYENIDAAHFRAWPRARSGCATGCRSTFFRWTWAGKPVGATGGRTRPSSQRSRSARARGQIAGRPRGRLVRPARRAR